MKKGTISKKGQIVIPKPLREQLALEAGAEVVFELLGNTIIVRPVAAAKATTPEEVYECAQYKGPSSTVAEMNQAVEREAARRR
jgi:AbrB family looped-hinge helix DNA binding protein